MTGQDGPRGARVDVYSTWLGLPAGPRPPHYYDLLQIPPFCEDQEQIREAVFAQICRVKPYEDHPDDALRERAQDLMNEIARAWVVLRDAQRKRAYDERLRREGGVSAVGSLETEEPLSLSTLRLVETGSEGVARREWELGAAGPAWIGRAQGCQVQLADPSVPARLARIYYRSGRWFIERAPEAAELVVNDVACTKAALNDGDRIVVGSAVLSVHIA